MRLFIALDLPIGIKDTLLRASDPLRKISHGMTWVKPDALHCTIKFLGEVSNPEPIKKALSALTVTPKEAVLAPYAEVFCRRDAATVLNVPFLQSDAITEWFAAIEDVLNPLGFARETRAFVPHCTLARYKSFVSCKEARGHAQSIKIPEGLTVATEKIHLIKSTLLPDGPLYAILCSYGG